MRRRTFLAAGTTAFTVTLLSGCSRDDGGGGTDGGSGDETDGGGSGGGGGPYGWIGPASADRAALGPAPEGDGEGE